MQHDERRKFHRIDFDGRVNLKFIKAYYDFCQVKNISLTGMYIVGDFKRHQVEDCIVKLYHKDSTGNNCLRALGKVVWSSEEGAGLQFTEMTFENYMLLQTTLIDEADHPDIILREFPKDCPFEIITV